MFQFPSWGGSFPAFPKPPGGSRPGVGSCYAANGQEGECATFRQCFPILYSVEEGEEDVIQNEGLAELLKAAAGPCESPVMANHFYFKAGTLTSETSALHFIMPGFQKSAKSLIGLK